MIVDFYLTLFPISQLPFSLNLWLYSVLLKLVPCLVLTIFTACLVHAMYQVGTNKYKNNLFFYNQAAENAAKLRGGREGKNAKNNSTEKTTKLLIVIVVLFLLAEFPMVGKEICFTQKHLALCIFS